MLDNFDKISKVEWLAKVEKDLKGKPMDSLHWSIEEMDYSPFFHNDDQPISGVIGPAENNSWEICDRIIVSDISLANKQATDSLMKGANALLFVLKKEINSDTLLQLFKGIHCEWISIHFEMEEGYLSPHFVSELSSAIEANGEDTSKVVYSVKTSPSEISKNKGGCIFAVRQTNQETVPVCLAQMLFEANEIIGQLRAAGLSNDGYAGRLKFQLSIHENYFLNIAAVRAVRLLWTQLADAWNLNGNQQPAIEMHLDGAGFGDNENTNKIRSTAQAMAAAIAGVDRLIIYPSDLNEEGTTFHRRIALNIHHLMQQESYLDNVVDPAAGSYFIEQLTNDIAEKAWGIFQNKT